MSERKGRASAIRSRLRRTSSPLEGAHGRRNIDGSYFAIWKCQHGHGEVAASGDPPDRDCMKCKWTVLRTDIAPTEWTRCSPREAHDFLFELEGFRMYDGVGFKVAEEVRHAI